MDKTNKSDSSNCGDKNICTCPFLKKISPPSLASWLFFLPTAVLGLALDLWTKSAVFDWLSQKEGYFVVINGFFNLVLATNRGAAFGIASGQRIFLIAISTAALIVLFGFFLLTGGKRKMFCFVLGLFAAGVTGNLCDRIFNNGEVRDFIDIYHKNYHWPAFNIADSMLCIAVVLLIFFGYSTEKPCQKYYPQQKSASDKQPPTQ